MILHTTQNLQNCGRKVGVHFQTFLWDTVHNCPIEENERGDEDDKKELFRYPDRRTYPFDSANHVGEQERAYIHLLSISETGHPPKYMNNYNHGYKLRNLIFYDHGHKTINTLYIISHYLLN